MIICGRIKSYPFCFRQHILTSFRFLGIIDKLGSAYEENFVATSFGLYFCLPLLRSLYHEDMSEEEARAALEECARVGYYRNCLATNRVCLLIDIVNILDTNWKSNKRRMCN